MGYTNLMLRPSAAATRAAARAAVVAASLALLAIAGAGFSPASAQQVGARPADLPPPLRKPPEPSVILGIARQESEFNSLTLSHAGARGILQVMPVTAKHVCRDYKIKCEIDRLMKETGEAVHLLLDTGHATWGGADPTALARKYRKRISHVHCKDVRPAVRKEADAKDWSFLDSVLAGVYTVPGDGMVDYVSVFKELAGYSGWVVVEAEQDPKKAEPAKYAKMGHDNLVRFLKSGGLP